MKFDHLSVSGCRGLSSSKKKSPNPIGSRSEPKALCLRSAKLSRSRACSPPKAPHRLGSRGTRAARCGGGGSTAAAPQRGLYLAALGYAVVYGVSLAVYRRVLGDVSDDSGSAPCSIFLELPARDVQRIVDDMTEGDEV